MDRKTSFLLYAEQADAIKRLDDEQRGKLLTALLAAAGGNMDPADQLDAATGVAFDSIWLQIGIDRQKFEETSERRAEAGRSGGLASGETRRQAKQTKQTKQTEANEANASKPKQSEAKRSKAKQTKQNENENENENLNTQKESKERKATPAEIFTGLLPSLAPEDSERVAAAFVSFWTMRRKIKAPLTDDAIHTAAAELLEIFRRRSAPFSADLAVAILNQSTFRAWRGLFDLKDDRQQPAANPPTTRPNAFHNFQERNYDYDAIMRQNRERYGQQAANMATGPP